MEYKQEIITHKQVPFNMYVCDESIEEPTHIYKYEFSNGLVYYVSTDKQNLTPKDLIESIEFNMDTVLKYNDSAYELQIYYSDYLGLSYDYKECYKIFTYYTDNKERLEEMIESYREELEQEVETESEYEQDSDYFVEEESDYFVEELDDYYDY